MKSIWKFPLEVADVQAVRMPKGAKILSAQVQHGTPCLWALVDEEAEGEDRFIYVFGTGHRAEPKGGRLVFIDTLQLEEGRLIFHVFQGVDLES